MNKNQIHKKQMYDTVVLFLDTNVNAWSNISKIAQFDNELKVLTRQIEQAAGEQTQSKVYVSRDKAQLKKAIAEKADIVNDMVECYAEIEGNIDLAHRMDDSFSTLYRMRNEEFALKTVEIIAEADTHKEQLIAEFGLTEALLNGLKADIDNFNELRGAQRAYKISTTQSTTELETLFSNTDNLLKNKLDRTMKLFRNRDPKLYKGYLSARIIID